MAVEKYKTPGTFEKCTHMTKFQTLELNEPLHPMGHYRCACSGCWACSGEELDCTCDIDWDELYESNRS